MKPTATYQDIYDCISFRRWKTLPEIKSELKREGKSVRYMSSFVYARLSKWEDEGYIKSRKIENSQFKRYDLKTEYLKVLMCLPEELRHKHGRLEAELRPAVA